MTLTRYFKLNSFNFKLSLSLLFFTFAIVFFALPSLENDSESFSLKYFKTSQKEDPIFAELQVQLRDTRQHYSEIGKQVSELQKKLREEEKKKMKYQQLLEKEKKKRKDEEKFHKLEPESKTKVKEVVPLAQKLNVALVSFANEQYELYDFSRQDKQEYSDIHGYDLHIETVPTDDSRPTVWAKIATILEVFNMLKNGSQLGDKSSDDIFEPARKYDWIAWVDADSVITNKNIKLEDLIQKHTAGHRERHCLITEDENGLNAGVFFLRNSAWSRMFLEQIYLSHQQNIPYFDIWQEQAVMMELAKQKKYKNRIFVIPQREINSYYDNWKEGDFIVHFAGVIKEYKPKMMQQYRELALNYTSERSN